jgi:hypothetical protein
MGNRGQTIEWRLYFRLATPSSGRNRQTAIIASQKTYITSERYTVDKKHVLNTDRKTVVEKSIGSVISGL